jgi:hypothetical protein
LLRAGISWVRSPLEGYSNAIIDGPEPSDWPGGPTAYSDYYVGILENSGSSLARMFRSVARNLHAPLLIGCHCGKDRSGLLIAALLSVCGYHRDVIVEDFARTGDYLLPHADHFEDKWLRRGHTKQQYLHRLRTHAGTLRLALEKIDSRWGSMELLLLNRAVDATDIRAIRSQIGSSHAS